MSTIKVDAIQGTSGASTAITLSGDTASFSKTPLTSTRPAFRVRKTSQQTASADNELVTWDSIDLNIGSHFASNIFTAPIAGVYFFTAAVLTPNNSTVQTYGFRHTPSGGSVANVFLLHSPNASVHETVSGSFIHQMGANDTMGLHIRGSGNGVYGESDQWNSWSGFLIG